MKHVIWAIPGLIAAYYAFTFISLFAKSVNDATSSVTDVLLVGMLCTLAVACFCVRKVFHNKPG